MFIWKGKGLIVPLLWLLNFLPLAFMIPTIGKLPVGLNKNLLTLIALGLSCLVSFLSHKFCLWLTRNEEVQTLTDENGKPVTLDRRNSFWFIRVTSWSKFFIWFYALLGGFSFGYTLWALLFR